jgi:nucleotide-binding universal stress UspA family protein
MHLGAKKEVRMSSTVTAADIAVKSVLIAFDFSEASQKPLHHALAIARHYGAKFYLAHVVSGIGYTIAGQEALSLAAERTRRTAHELRHELLESGALAGLDHEFIIREGDIWQQLELLIREKQVDMVVLGTHGRGALGKLILGSVAEKVFRHADCFVATVGPGSSMDSLIEKPKPVHPFLFPTNFTPASLHALPYAISLSNHFGAKLVVLHVLPPAPIPEGFHWSTTGDLTQMRDEARLASQQKFDALNLQNTQLAIQPEFMVKYGIPSEQILLASHARKTDLIIFGLHRPAHIDAASHMPWHLAYKVVCDAHCPVLTIRN